MYIVKMNSVVFVKTLYDDINQYMYICTKYINNSYTVKIYSKNINTYIYKETLFNIYLDKLDKIS